MLPYRMLAQGVYDDTESTGHPSLTEAGRGLCHSIYLAAIWWQRGLRSGLRFPAAARLCLQKMVVLGFGRLGANGCHTAFGGRL